MITLSKFEKEIVTYIGEGRQVELTNWIRKSKSRTLAYYKALENLKNLGVIIVFSGENIVDISNNIYKYNFKPKEFYQ